MGDGIAGLGARRERSDADCDASTTSCVTEKPTSRLVSHPGDLDEYEPPDAKVDASKTAEIARNMSAAGAPGPKLDELSWRELRSRIAKLESTGSDPAKLAVYRRELARRQGIAAEAKARDAQPVTHWGPSAEGHVDDEKLLATGKVDLATTSHGTVELVSVGGSVGSTFEANAAAARINHKTASGATTIEVGSGKASAGFVNADGSVGFHVAALATVVAVEHTESTKEGASATTGLGLGSGFELSFGVKGDGICGRVSAGPFTLGGCTTAPGQQASWGDDGTKR